MDTTCQYASSCPAPPAPPLTHIPLTSTSLPYTGASIAAIILVAVLIIAAGIALRVSLR